MEKKQIVLALPKPHKPRVPAKEPTTLHLVGDCAGIAVISAVLVPWAIVGAVALIACIIVFCVI